MATAGAAGQSKWTRLINRYERIVIYILLALLMVVIAVSVAELAWLLLKDLSWAGGLLLDTDEMFNLFGFFLLVLIGVELLTTLKTYISESVVHVEVVLEVALIAIAQKIIILDASKVGPLYLFGLAGLVLTLAAAFWWVRVARLRDAAPATAA
jgi:uncharacterized membrane protein (DUF373 family)